MFPQGLRDNTTRSGANVVKRKSVVSLSANGTSTWKVVSSLFSVEFKEKLDSSCTLERILH